MSKLSLLINLSITLSRLITVVKSQTLDKNIPNFFQIMNQIF